MLIFPIQLGPLLLQESLTMLLISIVISYITIYASARTKPFYPILKNTFWNVVLYGTAIWKLSYAVLHPALVLENPMSLLYFDGGFFGLSLAYMLAVVLILCAHVPIKYWFLCAAAFLMAYKLFYFIVHMNIIAGLQGGVAAVSLYAMYRIRKAETAVLYMLAAQFFFTLLQPAPFIFGLSKEQLLYLASALVVLAVERKERGTL